MANVWENTIKVDADGNATVDGNLTVNGTTTTIDTVNLTVEDKLIELAHGTTGTPSGDAGIIIERGDSTNAAMLWDESSDEWVAATTSATGSSSGDLTLTNANLRAADVTISGDIILDDGGSLKEAGGTAAITFDGSGNVTKIGQDSMSSGDVLTWDGAKFVGEAPTTGDITGVTAGDGLSGGGNSGSVTVAVDLNGLSAAAVAVASDSIAIIDADDSNASKIESIADLVTGIAGSSATTGLTASSGTLVISDLHPVGVSGANNQILTDDGDGTVTSESKLTFDGTTLLVDSDVTATTNHTTVGAHIDYDATGIIASGQTGNNVGLDLDINSDSPTMVGTVNNTGLDIDLTGGTSGTQTNIGIDVNVTGADTNYAAVFNGGNVGIGTSVPATSLHVAGGPAYLVIQNTINQHGAGEAESRIIFADHAQNFLAQVEASHVGSGDDDKGQLVFSTNNDSALTTALTIDDTQTATFAGDVVVAGTTPKLTIGDAGTEDTMLAFDGNAQDFRIGIDDGTDTLEIGVGQTHGTTPTMILDPAQNIDIFGMLTIDTAIADEKCSGITAAFTAGEALNRGDVVYFKAADSKMHKVNMTAGNSEAIPAVAMAAEDISADAVGKFLMQGVIHDAGTFPSYTVAGRLYAPEAEGPPTQTKPSTDGDLVQVIGWAITADKIYFNPSPDYIEVA